MDSESVPEHTREFIFECDGERCWLCHFDSNIHIAHQIDAAAQYAFSQYHENGIIPLETTNVCHRDNLFPLCPICHAGYDLSFPSWVLIPDGDTLQKYIYYEKKNYEERYLISKSSPSVRVPPWSLPKIDRNQVLYLHCPRAGQGQGQPWPIEQISINKKLYNGSYITKKNKKRRFK